jgi:hypothetical protein
VLRLLIQYKMGPGRIYAYLQAQGTLIASPGMRVVHVQVVRDQFANNLGKCVNGSTAIAVRYPLGLSKRGVKLIDLDRDL